jgi:hypothetical protein
VAKKPDSPEELVATAFATPSLNGGPYRRRKADMLQAVSEDDLIESVRAIGFHLIETTSEYILICERRPLRIHS